MKTWLDKKVKVARSNWGSEYYDKFDENDQNLEPFVKLLQRWGICAQYTMLGIPHQNGVAKRWNCNIIKIVKSMLSCSTIPISLWMNVLKT